MDAGERVRGYLEKNNIVKKQLAEKMGISPQHLNSLLKGNMRADHLEKFAIALNTTTQGLLDERKNNYIDDMSSWVSLPVIGNIPAGMPIEAIEEFDGEILVPADQARTGCYALRVTGDSMHPLIFDGDVVVIAPCPDPHKGQVVVTRINSDGEVTLKRFQRDGDSILLVPENPAHQTRVLTPDSHIKILGCVISLHRRF